MRLFPLFLGFACAALLASPQARAGDDAALQAQVFGKALGAQPGFACFSRAYSRGHLAAHRKQNVTSILLLVKGSVADGPNYTAGVDFHFRRSAKHFQASGSCPSISAGGTGQELHCGIDCDGGTINVSLKDKDTILVKLPDGIAVSEAGKDQDGPSAGRFGSDDKVFKLSRAPGSTCLPLALEDGDKTALKALK